jgi:hypothetical protein
MNKTLIEKNKENAKNALAEAKERKKQKVLIMRAKEKVSLTTFRFKRPNAPINTNKQ